jgi:hypothetical protein
MESIQSGLHAIFEDEERGVTTPAAVVGAMAARIGRRRAGRMVGVSAGTLTLAGFAAAVPFALSHLGSSELTPGATPAATATDLMPSNPLGLGCGDPIPSSVASSYRSEVEVYTVTIDPRTTPTAGSETSANVATGGSNFRMPIDANYSWAVLARDGIVVGWTELRNPDTATESFLIDVALSVCPAARNDATGDLASGTYIEYLIDDGTAAR